MRAKELDTLLRRVRAQETVRLVAGREYGRTTLLNQLEVSLTALGFNVVRIGGDAYLSHVNYAALRETLIPVERFQSLATPSEIHDIVAVELRRRPNTAILIDDSEWLDLPSAQALAPLFARNQLSGVFVSAPFQHLTPEQRVVSHVLRADSRVELKALSFEQVGVLAETLLGGPVTPDVTSDIFSMSSGITGIAADILRTAKSTRLLQLQGSRWAQTERRLWNTHLEESIERIIAPLPEQPFRILHALALAGSLTAEEFYEFDPASAERLTRSGLITAFRDPQGESRVSPRPALITDYFRQRPIDLLHLSATGLLDQLKQTKKPRSRRSDQGHFAAYDSHAEHSDTLESHNAGLMRYLRDEAEERLASASRDWRRKHDAKRAVMYLEALLQSGGYVATAVEVLERTPSTDASPVDLLQLALHEQMFQSEVSPPASRHAETLRLEYPDHARGLSAAGIYLRYCELGRDAEVEAWLAEPQDDPLGFCTAVDTFIRSASGEVLPLSVLESTENLVPLQWMIAEQARLSLTVRHAVLEDKLDALLVDPLSLLPGDDPVPFLVSSYVRSQLLLTLGRDSEARHTLSQALSVGDLDLRYAEIYAAMLRWSAFLHYRDGRSDIAESLLSESRGYAELRGPMPGMRPEFGDALEVLLTGDRRAASARFLQEANACIDRSFFDAAWSMLRIAFQLDPSDAALNAIESFGQNTSFAWATQVAAFARAALSQDPSIILYISKLSGLPELATAATFLDDIEWSNRERGVVSTPAYARAVDEARQSFQVFREPVTRSGSRRRLPAIEALTPREREIAPLTATLSNREIADRLTLSVRTVENHIARSMKKLGLASRTELGTALSSISARPGPTPSEES